MDANAKDIELIFKDSLLKGEVQSVSQVISVRPNWLRRLFHFLTGHTEHHLVAAEFGSRQSILTVRLYCNCGEGHIITLPAPRTFEGIDKYVNTGYTLKDLPDEEDIANYKGQY